MPEACDASDKKFGFPIVMPFRVQQCAKLFFGCIMIAVLSDANAVVRTSPEVWSISRRHGVPLAPDARVSPSPTAISASSVRDGAKPFAAHPFRM